MGEAERIWREYGYRMGWSLEKCQFLVEDYHGDRDVEEDDLDREED